MKDKRKIFFTSLLTILLIFSNIVVSKITVVANLPLSCSIFIYPFTFLCITIIADLYGAKEAMKSVAYAIICQILVFILCTVIANLPNQVDTLMQANALQSLLAPELTNGIYHPNFTIMIGTLLSFGISQLINIGLYTLAKKYTFKVVSSALAILFAFVIDTVLFNVIKSIGVTNNNFTLTIINQFVVGVVITVISVILFCIFTAGSNKTKKLNTKKED